MEKIVILGAGMVGRAIAKDLCDDYRVTSADINADNLARLEGTDIELVERDLLKSENIRALISDCDIVIGAVPGFMGFETLKTVIESGKDIVDISFFNEDPFELDSLAKDNEVTAVMDCGVAPGMSNFILGYHNARMKVDEFTCFVGGLPRERVYPYQYKAPFSPIDVIEEYKRPARLVEDGETVIKPALSEPELLDFPNIGTLEAFNTDGLRSLIKTMDIPDMKEKTLRYPGHIELMRVFRETGLLNDEPIEVSGKEIRPIDVTTKLLFPLWELGDRELEFTVMRIEVLGLEAGERKKYNYSLFDEFDPETGLSSMARTTGYPCTAVARLVLNKQFNRKGVFPPEFVGADERCFKAVMEYQRARNIYYQVEEN